ncbi:SART-1 family protein DOT2 [Amborella trichopoda]|uniref:SART-1 family protein DOT2 n=1 Tax=Amborella trichopoda TaxID=13333 RepID=W1NVH3_AMBTC|nr:SART-1 family protein DOT2 [Amborella trichopoda]ERM99245.1 hypothetical protein AMTR_s00092p00135160 [Amborella trichopoda]|eukprot:XP_006836392.1 SART-1 family protein DOT2 [Amborella trichopoda]
MDMEWSKARTADVEQLRDEEAEEMEEENDSGLGKGISSSSKYKEKSIESRTKDHQKNRERHKDGDRKKEKRHEDSNHRDRDKGKSRASSKERRKDENGAERRRVKDRAGSIENNREMEQGKSKRENEHHRDREDHSRDKERERDRERKEHDWDRDKEKERDKDKTREKERDRDRYTDKEHDRDRERDRAREKEDDRGKERDKEREKDREKEREHDRDREKEREHDRDRERTRERGKEKEIEKEREREKDKDREKEKNKEREKEKDRSKDREKLRDRQREKDIERDGLEKDRMKEKLREKEKERDKYREKERISDKERDKVKGKSKDHGRDKEFDRGKEGEKEAKPKIDAWDGRDITEQEDNVQDDKDNTYDRTGAMDHKEKNEIQAGVSRPSTSEIEERLAKMREERMKKKNEGVSEVSSWVNKSRKIEEKLSSEKEKALHLAKVFAEQDSVVQESDEEEEAQHSGKDLAGVKVLHGLEQVIVGGAVVLTLKDQNILADGDLNNEVDMLENVELGEQKRRDEAYKAAKKKPGIYEDKFADDDGSQKKILPQYDDTSKDEGVALDESGHITREAQKKLEELRKRLQGASTGQHFEDLTATGKVSSDYYTQEEMLQFKKPKKKKALRKKVKLDLDALEAEAIASGLGVGDRGSRADAQRQRAKEEEEWAEAETRKEAYQSAFAKANESTKALREEQTLKVEGDEDENLAFGDDEDLHKSIEEARKLARKKQDEGAASGPLAVAQLAVSASESKDAEASGEPQENRLVFTEVDEFVLGLQHDEGAQNPDAEDVFKEDDEVQNPIKQDEPMEQVGGWTDVIESEKDEQMKTEEDEEVVPDATIQEAVVGKGLSGALQLLKERGTLKEAIDWGGRNMDKKKSKLVGVRENDGAKEIVLDRLDEFGRIMTPKEAFRKLSHKFHGKGPGKMKQEKRMKQFMEELKLKQMKASDTPLLSMEKMREAQAKTRSPYIVLSGQIKPGQTSDPRSGFATVEKDQPGSLTPMLGDRKVEHFLGIKRKAEPSNMGPPKKPKG